MESRLGDLLIERGVITADRLRSVLSDFSGEPALALRLVSTGALTEEQLVQLMEKELQRPRVDPAAAAIAAPIARLIPAAIARRHHVIALALSGRELTVAMADPTNLAAINEIRLVTGYAVRAAVATVSTISAALSHWFPQPREPPPGPLPRQRSALEQPSPESGGREDAPVIRLIDALLARAIELRASDLHFEPYEDCFRVRFRIDGMLQEVMRPPPNLKNAAISRLKVMASLDIAERRLPQDGRFRVNRDGGMPIDFRISVLPTLYGEKAVLRVLDHRRAPLDLEPMAHNHPALAALLVALQRPNGMILVTGPTGSGKTTTLYAALATLNAVERNVCTVEDPVELHVEGVNQVQINDDIGLTFSATLRALLRQDPDVILVGEIRDQETAAIAVRAALTGHLVLSTLHTNDCAAAIARLLDMQVPSPLLASALNLVVAQRLVRQTCRTCAAVADAEEEHACQRCGGTRYYGRTPVFEAMTIGTELRRLIQQSASTAAIREHAISSGMTTLSDNAERLIREGVTDAAEIARAVGDAEIGQTTA